MNHFHPVVSSWFNQTFEGPTQPQLDAWQAISRNDHALVAAPTGSGKTLAAFLSAINDLVFQQESGELRQEVSVVYVSPLKALSNDIQKNLEEPLRQIQGLLDRSNSQENDGSEIQAAVRTGDTSQWERSKMIKTPPHILVTTPESLYILLTSKSGRQMLKTARTLIIDEIHAMVSTKRGAHLSLSMERLQNLCDSPLTRIGLSATQKPIDTVARFLTGVHSDRQCRIIDSGHQRNRDVEICLPSSPLEAVMAGEVWNEIYQLLETLIETHQTTLIFVNTRRLAERLAKALGERLGEQAVTSHHGSLAKEHRFSAEQRLKSGKLRALVATASLELGIDIGDIDLVCQIGSPRAVSVFLQRVGRSGHGVGRTPKGRLFPLSRDDLVECVALLDAVNGGELDELKIYPNPLDVLAQQVVAEVSAGERSLDEIYGEFTNATPYEFLKREEFDQVVKMLADGFSTRRGRRSAYLHYDAVNQIIKPRKGARLTAITNGGTIPDQFDYDVILQPEGLKIGTLHEDFSFESLPGDIFQLGNTSYQILKVELGKVFVRDAAGQPPNIPFWLGESLGRTDAISDAVSKVRLKMESWLGQGVQVAADRAQSDFGLSETAAQQLTEYLGAAHAALGALPSKETIIFERFFDEAGDQHLVVHSSFGSRLNRAWGLALRKRFCRKFNFELQAAALEDTIILSLGSTHSFPLDEPARYLKPQSVKEVLTQALLDAPMFPTHWRWNATIALAIRRFSNGSKTPPQFQRSNAEDLVAVVFPDQIACAENIAGQREIPDHPLVAQTLFDCLHDLMDVNGLQRVLQKLEKGEINLVCKDLTAPSPLSEEVLTAKPYAFLDDAPAEERRTALVRTRQFLHPEDARSLGQLDQRVIDQVRQEAWPQASNHDECHDGLLMLGGVTEVEAERCAWSEWLKALVEEARACRVFIDNEYRWVARERLEYWFAIHSELQRSAELKPLDLIHVSSREEAVTELIRMRLQGVGPVCGFELAEFLRVNSSEVDQALALLEQEGYVMRGHFDNRRDDENSVQWCERGLLARIHRRTLENLRKQIQPVSVSAFMRYLFHWQGVDGENRSEQNDPESLAVVLQQLEGIEVSAAAWEESVLPLRLEGYMSYWLDILCASGRFCWGRIQPPTQTNPVGSKLGKQSPISLFNRENQSIWYGFQCASESQPVSSVAQRIYQLLQDKGAQFLDDIVSCGGWVRSEVEQGLSELAYLGWVNSDNFSGLRALIETASARGRSASRFRQRSKATMTHSGRWSVIAGRGMDPDQGGGEQDLSSPGWERVEYVAWVLLTRYGVVFRRVLDAESNVPSWRELLYVFRRMEARGEVRGGRFVQGMSGEQFALPEALGLLRRMAKDKEQKMIAISASDPLNLTGIVLPGERVPSVRTNRILFRNGKPIATLIAGEVYWMENLDAKQQWQAQQQLISVSKSKLGKFSNRNRPVVH